MLTYEELITFKTFSERLEYLKKNNFVGNITFGGSRELNQKLYRSKEWKRIRSEIIRRDNGCDLAIPEFPIYSQIIIHHLNPISPQMILDRDPLIFSTNNLICVSRETHDAIHYGAVVTKDKIVDRKPDDTILWKPI